MSEDSKRAVGTFYTCPQCGTGMNNVTDKVCPKCQWNPLVVPAHPAPVAARTFFVGDKYHLFFANSPEGYAEGLTDMEMDTKCVEYSGRYVCFENEREGVEFFLHDNGEWWDENHWTRLTAWIGYPQTVAPAAEGQPLPPRIQANLDKLPTLPSAPQSAEAEAREALKWLDENFGLHENDVAGNSLRLVKGHEGDKPALFVVDRDDRLWRFSEVLAAYSTSKDAQIAALEAEIKHLRWCKSHMTDLRNAICKTIPEGVDPQTGMIYSIGDDALVAWPAKLQSRAEAAESRAAQAEAVIKKAANMRDWFTHSIPEWDKCTQKAIDEFNEFALALLTPAAEKGREG